MLNRKICGATLALALFATTASFAEASERLNTPDYTPVVELKGWVTKADVYFRGGLKHECASSRHKTRFQIEADDKLGLSLLHSAFLSGKGVRVHYECRGGDPWILGVRVR